MDKPITLVEHLVELRKRIIICLIGLGLACLLSLPFASFLLKILKEPATTTIGKLAFFSPEEPFLIYMRLAFLSGWIISLPVILYQLWLFISPALDESVKKYSSYFIIICFLAFISGAIFAYFLLIPPALKFLLSFAKEDLEAVISANKYISFITGLIFASGLVFQMPVLSFILARLGIINSRILRRKYRYAIVIVFIVAAIITPTPDAFNMSLLALPMLLLYEVSVWVAFFASKGITYGAKRT
ncbi:MAG: twin-arginine translocase subunit TatC [Candidatus Omnitrophota bacterium]